MKRTLTIELLQEEVAPLLAQLETLNLLRVLPAAPKKAKARNWSGTLSKSTAKAMHNYLAQSREEWERSI